MFKAQFVKFLFLSIATSLSIYSKNTIPSNKTDVTLSYECFIDKTNSYDISQVKNIPFGYLCDINFPFFNGDIWIKVKLNNHSNEKKEIVLMNNDIINKKYKFYQYTNEAFLPPLNTKIDNRTFNFPQPNYKITLLPQQETFVVIHTKSDGRTIRATPFIISLNGFINLVHNNTLKDIFFYGVIFVIFLINLFYWNIFKSKFYTFYIAYILLTFLFYLGFDGYLNRLGIPLFAAEQLIFIFLKGMIFSLLLFSANFLNINITQPNFYKGLKLFSASIMLGVLIFQLTICTDSIGKIHIIEFFLGFVWLFLLMYMAISSFKRKQNETKYYIIAMSIALFFVLLGIMNISLATEVTGKNFFKIGTSVEFIIFTYTIAKTFRRKNEKLSQLLVRQKELSILKQQELTKKERAHNKLKKSNFIGIFKLLESNISNETEWVNFKNMVKELDPNFYKNLLIEHPNLTKAEIRLLTLIKIGFTQKEISKVLFIAESSVKKARQRVRKKIAIKPEICLTNYLTSF